MLDGIADIIDNLAAEGRRSRAAQLRLLVDEALVKRDLIDPPPGIKPDQGLRFLPAYTALRHLLLDNLDKLSEDQNLKSRLELLLSGESPTVEDKLRICLALNLPEAYINSLNGDKTNGNPASTV